MRANVWERIGKELKIKRKFYVSSRDVRIVCPGLKALLYASSVTQCCVSTRLQSVRAWSETAGRLPGENSTVTSVKCKLLYVLFLMLILVFSGIVC